MHYQKLEPDFSFLVLVWAPFRLHIPYSVWTLSSLVSTYISLSSVLITTFLKLGTFILCKEIFLDHVSGDWTARQEEKVAWLCHNVVGNKQKCHVQRTHETGLEVRRIQGPGFILCSCNSLLFRELTGSSVHLLIPSKGHRVLLLKTPPPWWSHNEDAACSAQTVEEHTWTIYKL